MGASRLRRGRPRRGEHTSPCGSRRPDASDHRRTVTYVLQSSPMEGDTSWILLMRLPQLVTEADTGARHRVLSGGHDDGVSEDASRGCSRGRRSPRILHRTVCATRLRRTCSRAACSSRTCRTSSGTATWRSPRTATRAGAGATRPSADRAREGRGPGRPARAAREEVPPESPRHGRGLKHEPLGTVLVPRG